MEPDFSSLMGKKDEELTMEELNFLVVGLKRRSTDFLKLSNDDLKQANKYKALYKEREKNNDSV